MLEYRQPFESPSPNGAGRLVDEPGLHVVFIEAGLLLLQSTSECTLHNALMKEIGLELPVVQQACVRRDYALLWLSPAEWLLALPAKETGSLQNALKRRLATSLAVVTDMSDAFACCEVSGARHAEALMSGCGLDLRTHAFPAGCVARTALADIPAIIWNPGQPQRLRCFVDRSFAAHVRDWLADVA